MLEVLDPAEQARSSLPELDLLSLFAREAAVALWFVLPPPGRTTTPICRPGTAPRPPGCCGSWKPCWDDEAQRHIP